MTNAQHIDCYPLVAKIIEVLSNTDTNSPASKDASLAQLDSLAHQTGKNQKELEQHLSAWAGINFKQLVEILKPDHVRSRLAEPALLAFDQGIPTNPLKPCSLNLQIAFTPIHQNETNARGKHLSFEIGKGITPFGLAFVSFSDTGLNNLEFETDTLDYQTWSNRIVQVYPEAEIQYNNTRAQAILEQIFDPVASTSNRLALHLKGTPFQILVWKAITAIPVGQVLTYGGVARYLSMPGASRAVGSAIARNSIGFLIPCHRVVQSTGELGHYRWQQTRKKAMFIWEQSLAHGAINPTPDES